MAYSWNKAKYHKPYELLKQLLISPQPWELISVDFIKQLPPLDSYTDIIVMVDRLTKQAVFVPTMRSINITALAEIFIIHVFVKHEMPLYITSDHCHAIQQFRQIK